jgi:Tol biopolymer transport system component
MTRLSITFIALLLAIGAQSTAAQQDLALDRLFARAQHKASVEGDLKGAIEDYKAIVARAGANRALAAGALLRMAEAYQKLGDGDARRTYERIVRDYADQTEVATIARGRIGATRESENVNTAKAVWSGRDVDTLGRVSPDGRFLTYVDFTLAGNLMVRDLVANSARPLTPKKSWDEPGEAVWSAISRDGKRVAYFWLDGRGGRYTRIADLHTPGVPVPRDLMTIPADIQLMGALDWSPDANWLAVTVQRRDGTGQIAVMSLADGSLRVLKSMDWQVPARLFFSSDSRYIAYALPPDEGTTRRDVFLIAIDGSRETSLVAHAADDEVMGWSPDGSLLLFASDRTGSTSLWGLPVVAGKGAGAPQLLQSDIGSDFSLGVTSAGSLLLAKTVGGRDFRVAAFDSSTGRVAGLGETAAAFPQGYVRGARNADWSPDGTRLVYAACGGTCIAIRMVQTGEVRVLPPRSLLYARDPRWSPDGRKIATAGRDRRGRDGVYIVDASTGEATHVVHGPGLAASPTWSPDGGKLYYRSGMVIVERDLASAAEREVVRLRGEFLLSPDGRSLAVKTPVDPATQTATVVVISVAGGEPRELTRARQPDAFAASRTWAWHPEGTGVVVTRRSAGRLELVLVPTDGGDPRVLDVDPSLWVEGAIADLDQGFALSRDGRRIVFQSGTSVGEIWALENFLPARSPKR